MKSGRLLHQGSGYSELKVMYMPLINQYFGKSFIHQANLYLGARKSSTASSIYQSEDASMEPWELGLIEEGCSIKYLFLEHTKLNNAIAEGRNTFIEVTF